TGSRAYLLHVEERRRNRRAAADRRRRRAAVRLRVDEELPGLHRPSEPAHPGARPGDARPRPARGRLRCGLGGNRCGWRGARGDRGVRPLLVGSLPAHQEGAQPRRHAADPGGRGGGSVKVLIVSGIWPPDVGGPASHAPDVADFLVERGHAVEVVTTAEREPGARDYPLRWVSRARPLGVRHAQAAALIANRARAADVVYTTGMF